MHESTGRKAPLLGQFEGWEYRQRRLDLTTWNTLLTKVTTCYPFQVIKCDKSNGCLWFQLSQLGKLFCSSWRFPCFPLSKQRMFCFHCNSFATGLSTSNVQSQDKSRNEHDVLSSAFCFIERLADEGFFGRIISFRNCTCFLAPTFWCVCVCAKWLPNVQCFSTWSYWVPA